MSYMCVYDGCLLGVCFVMVGYALYDVFVIVICVRFGVGVCVICVWLCMVMGYCHMSVHVFVISLCMMCV